jgi:hypothetical protein
MECEGDVITYSNNVNKLMIAVGFKNGQLRVLDDKFGSVAVKKDRTKSI